jgi:general secretion pathway protein G
MRMYNKRRIRSTGQEGFSLIEIMIVITLIGMIATFAIQNFMARQREGQRKGAKIIMQQLKTTLDDYYRICSSYPTIAQGGLDALVSGPTDGSCKDYNAGSASIKKVPKDPWGSSFIYFSDDGRKYVLKSFGPDKREGGEGDDKDISTEDPDF